MRKVDPKSRTEPTRILIEGDPGSGKTRLADTANLHDLTSPALHLDLRGNTVTLRALDGWEHHVLEIETIRDIEVVYNWLAAGQPQKQKGEPGPGPALAEMFPDEDTGGPFQTVILDTLTQYHNMALNEITGNKLKRIGERTKQPQIQDWGELLRQTVYLMGKLGELNLHVIITVQSSEDKDNITGQILHRPQLWGKSVKEVPAFVYIHAYLLQAVRLTQRQRVVMDLDEDLPVESRVALFTPRFDSMAKDQYGVLGPHMLDPSIPKIIDMLYRPEEE